MRPLAEISLPVNTELVARALKWLQSIAGQQGWPGRTLFKLQLCLDETLTNIAMYGGGDRPPPEGLQVKLRLLQDDARLALEVADNGVAFDPTARASRSLDSSLEDARVGGHGLRLLRHYLKDIRYERRDGWNRLTLLAIRDDPA